MEKLFEKNIQYLYYNLPHYYQLITQLNKKRFLIKNNNIFDILTNSFIYPHSIEKDSKIFAANPINNNLYIKHFTFINPQKWENNFYITGKIVNKLIEKFYKLQHTEGFYFDKNFLPTTIIYGLLAGKHIDLLIEKYEFQSLLIYEPNPEFFAISLYFMDLEKIYNKLGERFFIQIGGELSEEIIQKFLNERIVTSSFLQLELSTYNNPLITNAKNKFEEFRNIKLRGWGTYEDEMKGIINHKKNINNYPLLKYSKNLNIPFCIVANGKSLEKNINFIKKNKDSMIIVSVGTALRPLLKAGIESDFHIEQERIDLLINALKDILPNYNGVFLGANVVNPKVFKMAKKPFIYIREGFTFEHHFPRPLIFSSPIVGNTGISFAANFTREIYLCGMDLGFRLGDKKHSKNSFYDDKNDIQTEGIKVKGNFSDDIYSDSLLLSSKLAIEKLIKLKNLKIYNLSDGAYINGSIPLKDKTLPKINKSKYIKEILSCFTNEKFEEEIPNIYPLLNAISNGLNHLNINDYKHLTGTVDFLEDLITAYSKKDPSTYSLLRGSLWHILLNFYILSHKLENKNDIKKLAKIIKKDIFKFEKTFKKDYFENL
jgi:hypothetical protein